MELLMKCSVFSLITFSGVLILYYWHTTNSMLQYASPKTMPSASQIYLSTAPNASASNEVEYIPVRGLISRMGSSESTFKAINNGSFVYSAFYDSRSSNVRVIGIADKDMLTSHPVCLLWLNMTYYEITEAKVERLESRRKRNPSSVYLCQTASHVLPSHVTLTETLHSSNTATLPVLNVSPPRQPRYNLSVCVHAAFYNSYPPWRRLVEFVEVYRLLGADRIIMYNATSDSNITPVLQHYANKIEIEMHQWQLPPRVSTHYLAQRALIEDCLYRHMPDTRFLTLVNIDEFIIPAKHYNLMDLLTEGHCRSSDVYVFQNVFFPLSFPRNNFISKNSTLKSIDSLTLGYTMRDNKTWGYNARSKIIIQPRKVITGNIHGTHKVTKNASICHVPEWEASLHHYRKWKTDYSHAIEDTSAHRFFREIAATLIRVFRKLESDMIGH